MIRLFIFGTNFELSPPPFADKAGKQMKRPIVVGHMGLTSTRHAASDQLRRDTHPQVGFGGTHGLGRQRRSCPKFAPKFSLLFQIDKISGTSKWRPLEKCSIWQIDSNFRHFFNLPLTLFHFYDLILHLNQNVLRYELERKVFGPL